MTRIIVALIVLIALIEGLSPGVIHEDLLPLALVVLGLIYGWTAIDAEDPTTFLVVVIAVGMASQADIEGMMGMTGDGNGVLYHIPYVGSYLDSIVDQIAVALYGAVMAILCARIVNRLKG